MIVAASLALGCGDEVETSLPTRVVEVADEAPGPSHEPDPLLARARGTMVSGQLDPAVAGQLIASKEPAHARARRLLRFMRSAEAADDDPASDEGDTSTMPQSAAVNVTAPLPKTPVSNEIDGESIPAVSNDGGGGSAPSSTDKEPLAMLTSLRLEGGSRSVTLKLSAGDHVVIGIVEQPESNMVRLVMEGAGALPAVLQSRPERAGVKVVGVRKGENAVHVALQLEPGWRPLAPRTGRTWASLEFVSR